MSFHPDIPYNELPLLPPAEAIETPRILKKVTLARVALAELKSVGRLIPNQSVLIQTIGLQEAKLSSEIENIVTTNDNLYRALSDGNLHADKNTKEVLRYKEALAHGYNALSNNKPLGTRLFEEIFQIVKKNDSGVRTGTGTKLKNPATEEVKYTPPQGESLLRDKLANMEKFLYDATDIDPLIRMAVGHYQFEAIHPFTDGNGRTGRIINILYLIEQKLLKIPVLYLSRYIIENKPAYYDGLMNVTAQGKWEEWILFMLQAVEETARFTRDKILSIKELMDKDLATAKAAYGQGYSKEVVEIIYKYPYCKVKFLEDAGFGTRITATKRLKELEKIGILTPLKIGREIYYFNDAFFAILSR